MKKVIALLMCLPSLAWSQENKLSDRAEISVVTLGPSLEELYAAFGHSAFRVHDPAFGYDAVFNYGVFDFNQPNFYLNFAKGYLYYKLGVYDYQRFQNQYILDNRYVHEQVLNISQDQKQKLFDYLQWNALPENQSYRYDYFYDNCATKIRDVMETALGKGNVTFDGSYIKTNYTIRELTDIYLTKHPWGDLGIDICLGLPMDKVATPREYMFLPEYIESGFDHAFIISGSEQIPLVKKKHIIYEAREQDVAAGLPHPLIFTSILAVVAIALAAANIRKNVLSTSFDAILFGVSGLIGILLFFLWFFTDHNAAARNMNLLWAMPLHLIAVVLFIRNPPYLRHYFLFTFVLTGVTLLVWGFLSQQLHYALIPLVIAQSARAFAQYKVRTVREIKPSGVKTAV